jgi:hypothetical protein
MNVELGSTVDATSAMLRVKGSSLSEGHRKGQETRQQRHQCRNAAIASAGGMQKSKQRHQLT